PPLAALWTLSGAFAAIVSVLAIALFALVLVVQAPNRTTILSIGAVTLLLAIAVRTYATSLAAMLGARGNNRLVRAAPAALAPAWIRPADPRGASAVLVPAPSGGSEPGRSARTR